MARKLSTFFTYTRILAKDLEYYANIRVGDAPEFFESTRYAGPAGTYPVAQPPFLCHCSALETAEKPLPTHAQYDARVH